MHSRVSHRLIIDISMEFRNRKGSDLWKINIEISLHPDYPLIKFHRKMTVNQCFFDSADIPASRQFMFVRLFCTRKRIYHHHIQWWSSSTTGMSSVGRKTPIYDEKYQTSSIPNIYWSMHVPSSYTMVFNIYHRDVISGSKNTYLWWEIPNLINS